jgi:hypothetical protein
LGLHNEKNKEKIMIDLTKQQTAEEKTTGQQAWENLQKDKIFCAEIPEVAFPVFQKLIESFPEFASEIMQKPLNVQNLLETKLQFLEHTVAGDFPKDYAKITGQDGDLVEMLIEMLEGLVASMVDQVRNSDVNALMKEHGQTFEDVLASVGITHELEEMTMMEFYINYPRVISKNDS